MALEFEVSSLDGIDEKYHGDYKKDGDIYRLELSGMEDTGALKRAKEHEKEARKLAEQRASAFETQLQEMQQKLEANSDEEARKKGDLDALEKSWKDKLTKRETELLGQIDGLNGNLKNLLVDREAVRLANELAIEGSSDLLLPHIKSRLAVDQKDGQFVTVVNDAAGKPSALSLEELAQEFKSNPAFAPVIVGTKATGGGAAGGGKGGSAHHGGDLSKMNRQEKLDYYRNKT